MAAASSESSTAAGGSDETWPDVVLQAFRDHGEPMTWQMAQSLASKTMKAAGVKYGKNTTGRREQFYVIMVECHGPGWKGEARINAQMLKARLHLDRVEAEARLRAAASDALLSDEDEDEAEEPLPGLVVYPEERERLPTCVIC